MSGPLNSRRNGPGCCALATGCCSFSEAEDVVQEAWLRWARVDGGGRVIAFRNVIAE
jgi:hypothetical protein